jgi:polyhydroxyalkanoate synthesis regulator phasin
MPNTIPSFDDFEKPQASSVPKFDDFEKPVPQQTPQTNQPDAVQRALNYHTGNNWIDAPMGALQGVGKSVMDAGIGVGSLLSKIPGMGPLTMGDHALTQEDEDKLTRPNGIGQGTGKFLGDLAQYAIPAGEAAKATKGLGILARMATQGVVGGGVSALQSKGDPASAAIGAITGGAGELAAPAIKVLGKVASNILGKTTGAGEATIQRAFDNPQSSELVKAMRGEYTVNDIVNNVQKSVSDFSDSAKSQYRNKLDTLVTNGKIPNWNAKGVVNDIQDSLTKEIKNFGGEINPDGTLNLRHVSIADRPSIQSLHDEVSNWGSEAKDLTPSGLDSLKKDIIGPVAGSGGKLGALATRVYNTAKEGIEREIPGYGDMTKDYAQSQDLLRDLKSEMSVHANGQGNPGLIARKLSNLMKQTTDYKQSLIEKLPNGKDLMDQIAGFGLSPFAPKGLAGVMVGGEGLAAMAHPSMWGPAIATAASTSPRLVGEGSRLAGQAAKSKAAPVLGNIAKRGIQSGIMHEVSSN